MKELKANEWLHEIERGLEYRKQYGLEQAWARLDAAFYHVLPELQAAGPNIMSSVGDALISALTVPKPDVTVEPLRMESVATAPVVETLDGVLLHSLSVAREFETASLNAFLFCRGIVKLGYDSQYGYDPELEQPELPLGGTLSQFDTKGRRIEFGGTEPGMPWAEAVSTQDFVVPFGAGPVLDRSPWCAHRIVRHVDLVKADPKYTNTRGLEPTLSMEDNMKGYLATLKVFNLGRGIGPTTRTQESSKNLEFVELWEIRDRRTGKIIVVSTGDRERILRSELDPLQLNGKFPFVSWSFVPQARTFWTTPDAYYVLPYQEELNDMSVQRRKQRRVDMLKGVYNEDAIDPEEVTKLTEPKVGALMKVNSGFSIKEAVGWLTQSTHNLGLQQDMEMVRRDVFETVGFSRNQVGQFEGGRRTATEANIVDERSQKRMGRKATVLSRAYEEFFGKLNEVVFRYWRGERVLRMVGMGADEWMRFRATELRGEYAYKVNFTQEAAGDAETRKQLAVQLYATLVQDPYVDPVALRKYLVQAFNDPNFSSLFVGEDQVNAQIAQQTALAGAQVEGGVAQGVGQFLSEQSANVQGAQGGQTNAAV